MWIETMLKKSALKLEKLDNDLKNYRSNSIKESIRRLVKTNLILFYVLKELILSLIGYNITRADFYFGK